MKVIFIEDVPNVARAGQTRVVADGFARNYLFRRKLAILANSAAAAAIDAHLKKMAKKRAIEEAEMAALAKVITGTEITLKAKVGEKERLYGSVTGADIAEELGKTISREIDKRKVELTEPLRQVGVYDVNIRFTHEIVAVVTVVVMSDEEGAVKPVRAAIQPEKAEEKETKPPREKEKKPKAEKKPKQTETAETMVEAAPEPAAEVQTVKPPKEKKPKAAKAEKSKEKAVEEEKPAAEEKKEKKPRAEKKTKKAEPKAEEEPKE